MFYKEYEKWREKAEDTAIQEELEQISSDEAAIRNKFYKELQFGTGGLRGEIGAGTACLNIYTIGKATQGVAEYVKHINGERVAISYDSRNNSQLFAQRAACIFAENGISVHLVKELMPTPFLSFATRYFKADVGIMITASHNPAKYNGYKVYGSDGCQITDGVAAKITEFIDRVDCFEVKTEDFSTYLNDGKIVYIGEDAEEAYIAAVKEQSIYPSQPLRVTYTPLNGTGYRIIPKILAGMGIEDINIVKEQAMPDGRFLTCPYPNPENAIAMRLGLQYAREADSDVLLATDPDADRVGIAVKTGQEYTLMSGNEVGALLMDFILALRKQNNTLPSDAVVIKSIVTTNLAEKIAQKYGVRLINVLTGFKYIGEQIGKLEKQSREKCFVFGFEESCGYLSGSYVRDKDAAVAVMLIIEMISYYKQQGKSLVERMNELYAEFGTYSHKLLNFKFPGAEGAQTMKGLLTNIRNNVPEKFAGKKVENYIDYLTQTQFDLPKADVMQFDLENGAQIIFRPSGTEPQIKVYLTVTRTFPENVQSLRLLERDIRFLFHYND